MNKIQRWKKVGWDPVPDIDGDLVKFEDHVDAVEAAKANASDGGTGGRGVIYAPPGWEWFGGGVAGNLSLKKTTTYEPLLKFKVGDRVHRGENIGTVVSITIFLARSTLYSVNWDGGQVSGSDAASIEAYVPPAPAKFKVGDRVTIDNHETYTVLEEVFYDKDFDCWGYVNTQSDRIWKDSQLTLYAPPVTTCGCPGGYVKEAETPTTFAVGDEVVVRDDIEHWGSHHGKIVSILREVNEKPWYYVLFTVAGGGERPMRESELTLYIPTPAELIPTLVEHEWVRGTIAYTNEPFSGYVYADDEMLWVGRTILIHGNGDVSTGILSIERCDAPVKS